MTRINIFDGGGPATREYRDSKQVNGLNTSSPSVTVLDIGAADPYRTVVAEIFLGMVNNPSILSATIGGANARINVQGVLSYASAFYRTAIISAPLPAGTTADVALTLSGSTGTNSSCRVSTFKALRLLSNVEIDTDTDANTSGPVKSLACDVLKDGLLFVSGLWGSSGNPSYSGVSSDYSITEGGYKHSGGSLEVTADELARAINVTLSGGTYPASAVAASFR